MVKSTKERFFEKINIKENGCWEWTKSRHHGRYGIFRFNNKVVTTHRMSWIIHFGEIPTGACVCHKCDNVICVNPEHLFIGSQLDNIRDRTKKGRSWHPSGSANPNYKHGRYIKVDKNA